MLCALKVWVEHGINLRDGHVQIGRTIDGAPPTGTQAKYLR